MSLVLAGALGTYARQFAVLAGKSPSSSNNDSAYTVAAELKHLGAKSLTLIDSRTAVSDHLKALMKDAGVNHILGHGIARVRGLFGIEGAKLVNLETGAVREEACDVIGMSGIGLLNPFASHRGTKPACLTKSKHF